MKGKKQIAPRKRNEYIVFIIVLTVVGLMIGTITFFAFFSTFNTGREENDIVSQLPENGLTAVITDIDTSARWVRLYDIERARMVTHDISPDVEYFDNRGEAARAGDFAAGDIIIVVIEGGAATQIHHNPAAWEMRSVSNVTVTGSAIMVQNTSYSYDSGLVSLYRGETFDIRTLQPINVVTLRGYRNRVMAVIVEQLHGYLEIRGAGNIQNGMISVGTTEPQPLEQASTIMVTEGIHTVRVGGENICDINTNVTIRSGETSVLNLDALRVNTAVVILNINQPNSQIRLNGELQQTGQPLIVPYGQHEILISREGFEDYAIELNANEPEIRIDVTLRALAQISSVTITTNPPDATVLIDDAHVGTSPVTARVEYGPRRITAQLGGDVVIRDIVVDQPNHNISINITPSSADVD